MTNHRNATTWILCARKARGNSSHKLYRELTARGINCYRVTPNTNPRYRPDRVRTIINWGVSTYPIWADRLRGYVRWINRPQVVGHSSDKIAMFDVLGAMCVPHTTVKEMAEEWLEDGKRVISRTIINGCRGNGIVISPPDPLPDARLYTEMIVAPEGGSVREYRAYIVGRECIDLTEKRRWSRARREEAGIDHSNPYQGLIRTNGNGWVFCRNTMQATPLQQEILKNTATLAAQEMRLDLGGVDLIARYRGCGELSDLYVVETNTAVSLVGDRNTVRVIADALAQEVAA